MARVSTYLNFPGTTEQAFNFYRTAFGGEFNGPVHRFGEALPAPGQPPACSTALAKIELVRPLTAVAQSLAFPAKPPELSASVTLREVTRHNLFALLALDAGDGGVQVASNAKSMAQAAVTGEAWPCAIYADEVPVGFLMLYDPSLVAHPEEPDFFLWRLMIDRAHQRHGHGRAAVQLLIDHVKARPHGAELLTSIVEPAPHLLTFYGSLGFMSTDRVEEGERVLCLALP